MERSPGDTGLSSPTYNWESLERLLNRMQTLLKEPLPSDIQAAFDVFRSTPRQSLGRQQELREIVLAAEKMFQELTTDYLITILSLYRMPVYPARCPGVDRPGTGGFFALFLFTGIHYSLPAVVAGSPLEKTSPGDDDHEQGRFGGARGCPRPAEGEEYRKTF